MTLDLCYHPYYPFYILFGTPKLQRYFFSIFCNCNFFKQTSDTLSRKKIQLGVTSRRLWEEKKKVARTGFEPPTLSLVDRDLSN